MLKQRNTGLNIRTINKEVPKNYMFGNFALYANFSINNDSTLTSKSLANVRG